VFNEQKMILGAVGGFLGAALVDLHAYSQDAHQGFNWRKALARWVAGGVGGVLLGAGLPITGLV
jgi:H+/Cl- antiporter ClcA